MKKHKNTLTGLLLTGVLLLTGGCGTTVSDSNTEQPATAERIATQYPPYRKDHSSYGTEALYCLKSILRTGRREPTAAGLDRRYKLTVHSY